jgi:hypothetical protein
MTVQVFDESKAILRLSDFISQSQPVLPPIEGYENQPLVSLEQAIEPIVSFVPDIEQMVRTVKQQCQQPEDNLSQDESASIMLYTLESSFYSTLNTTLYDENRQKLKPWFLYLRLIISALSKLPSTSCRTIYRGVKEDMNKKFFKGKTFIWWGFSSCTSSIRTIKQYLGEKGHRTMFIIDCNSAKDISRHSFYQTESDILLYPARQFQVISSLNSENELRIIHLKDIKPTHPLIHIPQTSSIIHCKTSYENKQLGDLIHECQHNSRVNLYQRNLNDDDMNIVVKVAINEKKCTELWLEKNQITSIGASIIANALNNNITLVWLSLSSNHVCDNGVRALAKTLTFHNSSLSTLALHSTGTTDKGAEYLAEMLKINKTLTELTLSGNEIGNRGIRLLATALTHHNNTLKRLYVSKNILVNDSSIDSLVQLFEYDRNLQELWIENCNLSSHGKQRLQCKAESKTSFILKI